MSTPTPTTCYAIKRSNYFYRGTFNAPKDGYIKKSWGDKIVAVRTKAEAERLAEKLADFGGCYYLRHGEYASPDFAPRRIKLDPQRVELYTLEQACKELGMDI